MNDTEMAQSKRDFSLKKAEYDIEVNTKVCYFVSLIHVYVCDLYYNINSSKIKHKKIYYLAVFFNPNILFSNVVFFVLFCFQKFQQHARDLIPCNASLLFFVAESYF